MEKATSLFESAYEILKKVYTIVCVCVSVKYNYLLLSKSCALFSLCRAQNSTVSQHMTEIIGKLATLYRQQVYIYIAGSLLIHLPQLAGAGRVSVLTSLSVSESTGSC